ncbi:TPA_asm: hypothetical protein [Porphyromonas phage phage022a_WW2931]|uniref:Uncharacterized protein n=1 Tax=Porphyromonas phage phage022a_WW2931 TaxID=3154112 RepID=A0AAT9JL00_9CAUD
MVKRFISLSKYPPCPSTRYSHKTDINRFFVSGVHLLSMSRGT